jgi:hypothetical protein
VAGTGAGIKKLNFTGTKRKILAGPEPGLKKKLPGPKKKLPGPKKVGPAHL